MCYSVEKDAFTLCSVSCQYAQAHYQRPYIGSSLGTSPFHKVDSGWNPPFHSIPSCDPTDAANAASRPEGTYVALSMFLRKASKQASASDFDPAANISPNSSDGVAGYWGDCSSEEPLSSVEYTGVVPTGLNCSWSFSPCIASNVFAADEDASLTGSKGAAWGRSADASASSTGAINEDEAAPSSCSFVDCFSFLLRLGFLGVPRLVGPATPGTNTSHESSICTGA